MDMQLGTLLIANISNVFETQMNKMSQLHIQSTNATMSVLQEILKSTIGRSNYQISKTMKPYTNVAHDLSIEKSVESSDLNSSNGLKKNSRRFRQ